MMTPLRIVDGHSQVPIWMSNDRDDSDSSPDILTLMYVAAHLYANLRKGKCQPRN